MTRRKPITAADLFVLLDREFRRRKPRECEACFVQLPYRTDARRNGEANWELVVPDKCERGCANALEDIVQQYRERYDLA